jgi:hypothetical protein
VKYVLSQNVLGVFGTLGLVLAVMMSYVAGVVIEFQVEASLLFVGRYRSSAVHVAAVVCSKSSVRSI